MILNTINKDMTWRNILLRNMITNISSSLPLFLNISFSKYQDIIKAWKHLPVQETYKHFMSVYAPVIHYLVLITDLAETDFTFADFQLISFLITFTNTFLSTFQAVLITWLDSVSRLTCMENK